MPKLFYHSTHNIMMHINFYMIRAMMLLVPCDIIFSLLTRIRLCHSHGRSFRQLIYFDENEAYYWNAVDV